MEEVNRYLIQKDRERIESYIERKKINATISDSGLWYSILNQGDGDRLDTNDTIRIEYNCFLLDGTKCYSSKETGPKPIIIGKSNIESGLDQGLRLLGRGGEAIFIIPSFLAHGLVGDGDRIPAMSVLVYEVKIIDTINYK
jgi:FKBP-type peptidyl-prolyl cis-trans isomerase FkpA